jgi:peptide/nickel transport system substrate-binding protein
MSTAIAMKSRLAGLMLGVSVLTAPFAGTALAAEGALVVARNMDVNSLDPARGFCDTCQIYLSAVYETLLTLGEDNKTLVPKLATTWKANADQTEFTFNLAPAAVFADGSPVTSADVAFSLQRLKNIKGDPSFLMDSVTAIDTPDDKTVVIHTKEPNSEFLGILAASYAGIVNKKLAEANGASAGADAATADTSDAWFFAHSAGSGPYTLESYTADTEIRFAANPHYWGKKPAIAEVIMKQTADAVAQAQMLESGAADVAMQIDPDTAASLSSPDVTWSTVPSFNFLYVALSPGAKANTTPLTKPIREAIASTIPR